MSLFLTLIVLGAALWFAVGRAGVRPGTAHEPISSVSEFSRAMTALDPTASPVRHQASRAPARRPQPRPAVGRALTGRPVLPRR